MVDGLKHLTNCVIQHIKPSTITKPPKIRFHPFFCLAPHWPWSHRRLQEQRPGRRLRWASQRGKSQEGRAPLLPTQRKPPSCRYPRVQCLSWWWINGLMTQLTVVLVIMVLVTMKKMKREVRCSDPVLLALRNGLLCAWRQILGHWDQVIGPCII